MKVIKIIVVVLCLSWVLFNSSPQETREPEWIKAYNPNNLQEILPVDKNGGS